MYRRILVATDLSEGADVALQAASDLAARDGAALGVCHVLPDLGPVNILFPQAVERGSLAMLDLEQRANAALEAKIQATVPEKVEVEIFLEQGVDYERIVARADDWDADLVVIGSRGLTGMRRTLLGSVAEKVVRTAGRRVLVAREGGGGGPVVAATDLSEPSLPAIRAGAAEAERRGRPLSVVYALELLPQPFAARAGWPFGVYWQGVDAETMGEVRKAAEQALASAISVAGVKADSAVVEGVAAAAIIDHLEKTKADLVVAATHGRTGVRRLALGSVAERLVREAHCSVLIVPLEARA